VTTKFYLYVSESKIDMLFEQIPRPALRQVAAELKIDIGILSASIVRDKSSATRFSKLAIVTRHIQANHNVGTVDAPGEYISSNNLVRWGPLQQSYNYDQIVYFWGETAMSIFGLAGSVHHLIGARGESKTHVASSAPYILAVLTHDDPASLTTCGGDAIPVDCDNSDFYPLGGIRAATQRLSGPPQKVEFLAKRLLQGHPPDPRCDGKLVVLGSPIYVELAE
jgi:hypothetical protein